MNLNNRIEKIIRYSELSASEFADEIGVQRSNISHILSGRNKPSLDFLMKIKEVFPEINWEWMIEGKGEMTANSTPEILESKINIDEELAKEEPPTLFFNTTETREEKKPIPREEPIANQKETEPITTDSQRLDNNQNNLSISNKSDENSISKIVIFYKNGKFEMFEP